MTRPMEFCAVMASCAAPGDGEGLAVVRRGALAAVFAAAPSVGGLRGLLGRAARGGAGARKAAGSALVARQKLLEDLMARGTVLPAAPGARLALSEAEGALAASAAPLAAALAHLDGLAQHQVRVSWDAARALARFRDAPEIAAALTSAAGDRPAFARALAAGAEALRARLGAEFAAAIAGTAEATLALPLEDADALANLAALTDAQGLAALERKLEAIDALWSEGLRIRLIGPSPAISFAALTVERPAPEALEAAAGALGLDWPLADGERVSPAFRRAAAAAHPDAGGEAADAGAAIAALRAAAALVETAARARAARIAAGVSPEGPFLALRAEPGVESRAGTAPALAPARAA